MILENMFTLWKQYSRLINNTYTLGQIYLSLAQAMYLLYKQDSNTSETPCQVLL